MLSQNRYATFWALPLALACSVAIAAESANTGSPTSAAEFFDNAKPASDVGTDISSAMKGLLSTARGGGEVLRTWAAWKSGDKQALPKLFELAKGGNSRAQNIVGYLLDRGEGVRQDSKGAAAYFAAASETFPLARYNLAVLTLLGRGVPKNEAKAMLMFEDAVKSAGVDLAAVRLSLYYLKKRDKDLAWKWANEGANRGNVTAYYLLGRILYERQEYSEAFGWLTKAAQASEPNAPAILSAMYKNGQGMDANRKMAAAWWLIYAGLNRNKTGLNAGGLGTFGLSPKEENEATHFASNWLSSHENMVRPDYDATILQASRSN
ncbi:MULTISPECIES: tetratricopeptide repeat protein [unclassified Pseudomonas]|uniref:tetratricopeptide repeat protein n=1 Tax=unclassified Pseudomonas TaxID=196821 RepID=UPI001CC10323|nr:MULTISPECIES: tetratricopeptide repeat protein [unclassified Pseudomonas]